MKLKVIKHYQPEDETFYGDCSHITVESDDIQVHAFFRRENEAEAFAKGFAEALKLVKFARKVEIVTIKANDSEIDSD